MKHLKGFDVIKVTPGTDLTVLLKPKVNDWFNYCDNSEYIGKLEEFQKEFQDISKMMSSPFSEEGLPQKVNYLFWNHC